MAGRWPVARIIRPSGMCHQRSWLPKLSAVATAMVRTRVQGAERIRSNRDEASAATPACGSEQRLALEQIGELDRDPAALDLRGKRHRRARGLADRHPIDRITIPAQPADKLAGGGGESLAIPVALPAGVERRAHPAVAAARQHEA